MKNKINLLVAVLFTCFLNSCGPVYDTQYSYIPPDSSEGRACIFQCENSRSQCQELEQYRSQDCERRSSYDQDRCEEDIRYRYDREPKWYECGSSSCTVDEERCESQYRYCYESCGGKVDQKTVCVSNCETANRPLGQTVGSSYPPTGIVGGNQKKPRANTGDNSIYPRY